MGRNAINPIAANKHKVNGRHGDSMNFKKREAKKTPALLARNGASVVNSKNDVNMKIQQLRNRMVYKKSSNAVLVGMQVLMFLVILNYYVDVSEASEQPSWGQDANTRGREARKMFGGYRITPRFCTPTISSRRNVDNRRSGPTICMFNHECTQRKGEVVGACMDGFLFGACCRLSGTPGVINDSVESGVVMMLDDKYAKRPVNGDDIELMPNGGIKMPQVTNILNENSNMYFVKTTQQPYRYSTPPGRLPISTRNPVQDDKYIEVSNHYVENPSTLSVSISHLATSTEKIDHDLTYDGVAQIANSLLQESQANPNIAPMLTNSNPESSLFSYSTISHEEPDTILLNKNGSEAMDIIRPDDFIAQEDGVQVSTMQTKPTMVTNLYPKTTSTTPASMVTHKPVYKFKPKPTKVSSNQDKFVLVQTYTKPHLQFKDPPTSGSSAAMASIESIMNMLNDTHPSTIAVEDMDPVATSTEAFKAETRITTEDVQKTTVAPLSYSSGYPGVYDEYDSTTRRPIGGHYITTASSAHSTLTPSTSYVFSSTVTRRPGYSGSTNRYPEKYGSTSVFYTRPSTNKDKNKIAELDDNNQISSTLSYDEYWGSNIQTTTNKNNKLSTSYVFSSTPTRRPISSLPNLIGPNYDVSSGNIDSFSSVTPTLIVLSSPDYSPTQNPIKFPNKQPVEADQPNNQDNFVPVPLKPHKKPPNLITINNFITSNNMIQVGQHGQGKPTTEKPSPTVLITPKPSTISASTASNFYSSPNRPAVLVEDPDKFEYSTSTIVTNNKRPSTATSNPSKKPAKKPSSPKPHTVAQIKVPTTVAYVQTTIKNDILTSPDDFINFPPVRNPNLNTTGSHPSFYNNSVALGIDDEVLQEVEFTTPAFLQEDEDLNNKMNLFVNKIVGSLQGTFQELHDIVILDKAPNTTITQQNNKIKPGAPQSDSEVKPTKKPNVTTKRPTLTSKKPNKVTTNSPTTKKPITTKKPVRVTTSKATVAPVVQTTKKPIRTTLSTKRPRPTKPKTTTAPPTTTLSTEAQILEEENSFTTETPSGDYKHVCGVRPLVKSGRIVGGKGATFGEWPWQVLVRESTWLGLFTKNKCGGVLITNRYVTTAAHCQPGFLASLVAVFGEFDISGELESKRSVSKNVRRVIVHRQYDAATFENDLALLELESPVRYDAHIVPICMPSDDADFTGRFATVTGWGRLKYGGGVPSVLQEVQVPVIENSVCQEMFHTAGHTKVILGSFLCAGYANGQKDSCEGDSGGPLVLQRADGRWELAGTVSHGIKCAAPYLPGVYMRTTFYKPWLKSITGVN